MSNNVMFTRIKYNEQGQTCFETRQFSIEDKNGFGSLANYLDAKAINFWGVLPGYDHTHNAIRAQLVALGGKFRVTTTNGDSREFNTGSLVLPEDIQGDGHRVEFLGEEGCVSVFIELTREGMDTLLSMSKTCF
jgi:hypothetical protein